MRNNIFALLIAGMAVFSSCESDRDSNPVFNQPDGFVLNIPALSDNVFDLNQSSVIWLSCTQPDYGFTAPVVYSVEISLSEDFESSFTLPTKYNTAKMGVSTSEIAIDATNLLVEQGKTPVDFPLNVKLFIRLKGELSEGQGTVYSNTISISGKLEYSLPPITLPEKMYLIGDFCDWDWAKSPEMIPVNGAQGLFWRMVYMPENGGLKFNTKASWDGNEIGYSKATIEDNYNAEVSDKDGNISFAKGGWYIVVVEGKVDGNDIKYTLKINEPAVYLYGPAAGGKWEAGDDNKFKVPSSADGFFESPAFINDVPAGTEEGVRACVLITGFDWWKSEFMVFDGKLEYRGNGGDQERVSANAGQKLFINFTNSTGKIE